MRTLWGRVSALWLLLSSMFIACSYILFIRMQMRESMTDATPMVVQAITACICQPLGGIPSSHYLSALRCLQTWMPFLRTKLVASHISRYIFMSTPLILIISLVI